jgi:hypothetical protein
MPGKNLRGVSIKHLANFARDPMGGDPKDISRVKSKAAKNYPRQ